jgi:CheY-like chemotaxis protein/two-component sensor histidine kinase
MLAYAGRGSMRTGEIELSSLLSELSDLANAALSKKAVLSYALHPEPICLQADENQILQVALNLVTNAAEAIGAGEGTIEVSTGVENIDRETLQRLAPDSGLQPGRYARLTVRDDGQGMDAATRARIFDPFFTTKFTGRGLGLAAVTGIVRRHEGFLEVKSTPGLGTTIRVYLPAFEECRPRSDATGDHDSSISPESIHVLVVDDEEGPRQVFRLLLEGGGCRVTEAVDGEDAIRVFQEARDAFDCVLLDQSMPRLGGHEVFQRIRGLRPGIPVVLVSGFSEEETFGRLGGAPLARALQKPIPGERLIATVREVIAEGAGTRAPSETSASSIQ